MSQILRNGQVWPRLIPGHSAGTLLAVSLLLLSWLALFSGPAAFANPASAFSIGRPPLKITVLVGPRNDFCYSDHIDAIEKLARAERDRINKAGGISGRHVEIQIRDDEGDARRTVANVSDALGQTEHHCNSSGSNAPTARAAFFQQLAQARGKRHPRIWGFL